MSAATSNSSQHTCAVSKISVPLWAAVPGKATDVCCHKTRILSRRQSREQGGMSRTARPASTDDAPLYGYLVFDHFFSHHPDYDTNNTSSECSFRVLGVDFEIISLPVCFFGLVPFTRDAYKVSNLWVGRPRRLLLTFERFFSL